MEDNQEKISSSLLDYASRVNPRDLFPTLEEGATDFALNDPYAFCVATCLDRGTKAEIIWTIPYWISKDLGHFDPQKISLLSKKAMTALVDRLPKKPRYVDAAPRTIHEITKIIVDKYKGDATRIWNGKSASDARQVFLRVYGVGPGIANMAVLLIEKAYSVRFSDLDRRQMDIKPDVNTMRVLYRLGAALVVEPATAMLAARQLNPAFPGEIDGALWMIGKHWCKASNPLCSTCPVNQVCPKRI